MKKIFLVLLLFYLSLNAEFIYFNQEVKVTSSIPEYQVVIEKTPYEECWSERVPVRYMDKEYDNDIGGSIVGGIIGGVLGHQIGEGKGKDAATIGGAIIGSIIGGDSDHDHGYKQSYQTQRKCVTKYKKSRTREFMGYKNVAYYKGHKIVKYSDTPLDFISLRVRVDY